MAKADGAINITEKVDEEDQDEVFEEPVMPHKAYSDLELDQLYPKIEAPNSEDEPKDLNLDEEDAVFARGLRIAEEIRRELGFVQKRTIEDAVADLCRAFREGRIPNSLLDSRYFNVKRVKEWMSARGR